MILHEQRPEIKLIKSFEGILDGDPSTVNLDPYLCPAGYWTIGWGHVVLNPYGSQIKGQKNKLEAQAVYPKGITLYEAEVLLVDDVRRFVAGVNAAVKVELNNNQFGALVSFAFNIGINGFRESTLLRLVNKGDFHLVHPQFMRWTKMRVNGVLTESSGLKRRRQAEAKLWETTP